jgi:outer membrane protein assembly factor BamB
VWAIPDVAVTASAVVAAVTVRWSGRTAEHALVGIDPSTGQEMWRREADPGGQQVDRAADLATLQVRRDSHGARCGGEFRRPTRRAVTGG